MEHPEAMDTGSIVISGLEPEAIRLAVRLVTSQRQSGHLPEVPVEYTVTNCSNASSTSSSARRRLAKLWSNLAPTESFWERSSSERAVGRKLGPGIDHSR